MNVSSFLSSLPPRDSAEMNLALANAIISLYRAQLACQGTDADKHPISHELERLQSYVKRLSGDSDSRGKVNKAAVARIVSNSINSD